MNKKTVLDLILTQLRANLALQTQAALLSRDEAISEESRPENKYDMHSQEAAYLAEGQARHAAETSAAVAQFESLLLPEAATSDRAMVGSLLEVAGTKGGPVWYFLGPRAGGLEVTAEGQTVLVVTPTSPLGRELLGKTTGATVRLPGRNTGGPHRIVSVY
ncbi:MAG: transcription elongation factor [Verrucomicrobia bacterium]|nr:transcription elongation factor [Verrucomicrobiota bacterium]